MSRKYSLVFASPKFKVVNRFTSFNPVLVVTYKEIFSGMRLSAEVQLTQNQTVKQQRSSISVLNETLH